MHDRIPHAIYEKNQPSERFIGIATIEALRLPPTQDELKEELVLEPDFDPASRQWDTVRRLVELLSLTNFMVPLLAHFQLAVFLDSMIRQGYVTRPPLSKQHVEIYHQIHEDRRTVRPPFRQKSHTVAAAISTALIGASGMGKTTTVERFLARYDQVIFHKELDLYQITYLHIESPNNGKGVKGLLMSIIEDIAELIPGNTYRQDHLRNGRATLESLQSSVRILLNKHCVGLLVVDEIQHVANSRKQDQEVMSELTTLANKSKTPVLYIGTYKAEEVLGLDLRQGRRSVNIGLGDWNPLPRFDRVVDGDGVIQKVAGEWVYFMRKMWKYCWLRSETELTDGLLDVFYDCTQGIIDLAIKLFIAVQARAMLVEKTERVSEQLIRATYDESFTLVHPMIEGLKAGDWTALKRFGDVRPPSASDLVEELARRTRAPRTPAVTTHAKEISFQPRIAEAAKVLGLDAGDAEALASQVTKDGTARNTLEGITQLVAKTRPLRPVNGSDGGKSKRKSGAKAETAIPDYPGLEERPDDFRNAILLAAAEGKKVLDVMRELNYAPDPEEFICLD